jgi:spermidine/putrescine transport system permease protein
MMRKIRLFYAMLYFVVLYLPIVLIIAFSFNDSVYIAFPLKEFTTRWYLAAMENQQLLSAFSNSMIIAVTTSIFSTLGGMLAAMATTRYRFRGRSLAMVSLFVPLALPTVVTGVALLSIFMMTGLGLSLGTVILGHLMICTPFSYGVLVSRFEGLSPDFERASMDLGEPPLATFFRVTLPLAMPGLVSSLLLTFTISFDEFILAFFLSSNSPTLPVFMWSQMRFPDRLPMVLALASVVIIVSSILIVISQRLRSKQA